MNQIKFSHSGYTKLHGQTSGRLIWIEIRDRKELCEEFVEYDTVYKISGAYVECKGDDEEYYPLPSGKLIVLVFLGDKLIPFSTVRRWTPMKNADGLNKEEWYRSKIGEQFEIVIKESP